MDVELGPGWSLTFVPSVTAAGKALAGVIISGLICIVANGDTVRVGLPVAPAPGVASVVRHGGGCPCTMESGSSEKMVATEAGGAIIAATSSSGALILRGEGLMSMPDDVTEFEFFEQLPTDCEPKPCKEGDGTSCVPVS